MFVLVEYKLILVGAVVRSEACPPGMQAVVLSSTSGTFFRRDLVMKHFYGHSLSSADSRRAVVSCWRMNVHYVLVNCLGGLYRNNVVRAAPEMT